MRTASRGMISDALSLHRISLNLFNIPGGVFSDLMGMLPLVTSAGYAVCTLQNVGMANRTLRWLMHVASTVLQDLGDSHDNSFWSVRGPDGCTLCYLKWGIPCAPQKGTQKMHISVPYVADEISGKGPVLRLVLCKRCIHVTAICSGGECVHFAH